MRTNEERIAALHRRAAQLEREKRIRQTRILRRASAAACLVLIAVLAVLIYGAAGLSSPVGQAGLSGSLFAGSGALNAVVIAIVAFLLGAAVTVFCFLLKARMDRQKEEDEEDDG